MTLSANHCYNCGAERDKNHFFWLCLIERFDIADAQMSLDTESVKHCDKCIQVECCPECDSEQT
jgi:hypothetical protein